METVDSSTLAAGLAEARMRLHHSLARRSVLPTAALVCVTVGMLWPRAAHTGLLAWALLLAGALGLRVVLAHAHGRAGCPSQAPWPGRFRASLALHGMVWGAGAASIGWHSGDPTVCGVLLVVVSAMCALAMTLAAFDRTAALLFTVPAGVPAVAATLAVAGPEAPGQVLLAIVFVAVVALGSRLAAQLLRASVHDQLALAARARAEHRHAEDAEAARQALADQHRVFQQLLHTTRQGVWFVDPQGITTDLNAAMCELLGRPREQVLGRSVFEFFDGDSLQRLRREIAAREAGHLGGYEVSLTRPDGTRITCHNNATPIHDGQGRRIGSVGLWTDLTDYIRTERELRIYGHVANSITDAVSVMTEDEVYLMVNDAWCRNTGIPREQALGRSAEALIPGVRSPERRQALDECLASGQPRSVRTRVPLPGLAGRLIETTFYPFRNGSLAERSMVLISRDITEQQASQLALATSEEYLRRTLCATSDGIFASDASGPDEPVRFVNPQFLQLFCIDPALAQGLTPRQIMAHATPLFAEPEAQVQHVREVVAHNLADDSVVPLRDGRVLRRRCVPAPKDGQVLRVWSMSDITAEVRALDAMRASAAEAERANQAKSQFLSHMSHELRTPLNAILGFGELLQTDPRAALSPQHRDWLARIVEGARQLLELINELLDMSRIEAGSFRVDSRPFAVPPVLHDCLALVQPLAQAREVRLSASLVLPEALQAVGDAQRLRQVLLNLLSNAIKYNCQHGEVLLEAGVQGGQLRLAVRDSGPGLDAAQQARLFQPFERLGAERGSVEGTGLGLALSHRLVLAMGGQMGVDSQPGVGSTFWCTLPLAGQHPLGEAAGAATGQGAAVGTATTA